MAEPVGGPPSRAPRYVRFLPTLAILVPAGLSLLAWLGPVSRSGLSGYFHRAPVTPWGIALVVAWFGGIVAVGQMSYSRGRSQGSFRSLARVPVETVHRWTCAVGLFGTVWAYWIASHGSVSQIIELWRTQQFNTLRAGFDYGVGVPTLRYATIVAGALSLAYLAGRARPRVLDVLSLVGLVGTSFLASRLALTAALFAAAVIIVTSKTVRRPRPVSIVLIALAVVGLFTALNYSRNAGTYREGGVSNPLAMAAINAQAYLAAPTQVTLGFGSLVMDNRVRPALGGDAGLELLLPSYAAAVAGGSGESESISSVVEVSPSLTTNGALPDLLFRSGWIALLSAAIAIGATAWAAARFLISDGVGPAIGGVMLYALAEVWRIFLLNQGIFHFLVLIGLTAVVIGRLREPVASIRRREVPSLE